MADWASCETDYLIQHVFLPKKIVHEYELQDNIPEDRKVHATLSLFAKAVTTLYATYKIPALEKLVEHFHIWKRCQSGSSEVSNLLNCLESLNTPNDLLPFFVRSQNALLFFEYIDKGRIAVSVSQVSLQNKETTDTLVDPVRQYPGPVFHVPSTRIVNVSMATQLVALDNTLCLDAVPSYRKKGEKVCDIRNLPNTTYVTEWLFPVLIGNETEISAVARFQTKMRDKVVLSFVATGAKPWRRSGFYTSGKLILRYFLLKHCGNETGTLLYKLCILEMTRILLCSIKPVENTDLQLEMIAKIAVKMNKVQELQKAYGPKMKEVIHLHSKSLFTNLLSSMTEVKSQLGKNWNSIQAHFTNLSTIHIDTKSFNFRRDTFFPVHHLTTEINKWKLEVKRPALQTGSKLNEIKRSAGNFPILPSHMKNSSDVADLKNTQVLFDTERYVHNLWKSECSSTSVTIKRLLKLLQDYFNIASQAYSTDPVRYSTCILTCYTLLAVIDRIAMEKFPSLLRYKASIDLSPVEQLLLPYGDQLKHLRSIETYFKYREEKASFPGLLDDVLTYNSFGVAFARNSSEMQTQRTRILSDAEELKQKKIKEVELQYLNYTEMKKKHDVMSCNDSRYFDKRSAEWLYKHTTKKCRKCKLNKQCKKILIEYYEWPLPASENAQNAVVFELLCPDEIGCLRDALHFMNQTVLNRAFGKSTDSYSYSAKKFQAVWLNHPPIVKYRQTYKHTVTLGSTTALTCLKHNSAAHPKSDPTGKSFIKPNGYDVQLIDESSQYVLQYRNAANLRKECVVQQTTEPYSQLQWSIDSTGHSDNEVFCRQNECPTSISLKEFKTFCSARAGGNLQLRNLMTSVVMDTLSFHQQGVIALVSQILWETGPYKESEHHFARDNHYDLTNEHFILEFIAILRNVLSVVESNWERNYTLLNLVLIGQRLLEFSLSNSPRCSPVQQTVATKEALSFLRSCRAVGLRWVYKLNTMLKSGNESPDAGRALRHKLVTISLTVCETFASSPAFTNSLIQCNNDVVHWLQAVSFVNDNVLLNQPVSSVSKFIQNLINKSWRTGLQMQETLESHIKVNPQLLTDFVKGYWLDSSNDLIGSWTKPCEPWYETVTNGCRLDINIITGSFLVNGSPISRLPQEITTHIDYMTFFGAREFSVLPGSEPGSFVTTGKFSESLFEFKLLPNGVLRIIDIRESNLRFRYIPASKLEGVIPEDLTENYSHWFCENTPVPRIDFRSKRMAEKSFFNSGCDFELYCRDTDFYWWYLKETKDDCFMIGRNTATFSELYGKVFNRLDRKSGLHMYCDVNKCLEVRVWLPRLGLSFICDINGSIQSFEFSNMKVASNQTLGTLIGFESGLLLKDEACEDIKKVIVPYGALEERTDQITGHASIKIDFGKKLNSPAFFVYSLNTRLQQLMAPSSHVAWLYLALLHLKTAFPLPDPFTGLTGNEMTIHILRTARSYSPEILTSSSEELLTSISKCIPKQEFLQHSPISVETPNTENLENELRASWFDTDQAIASSQGVVLNKLNRGKNDEFNRKVQVISWPRFPQYPSCCSETIYFLCEKLRKHSMMISLMFPIDTEKTIKLNESAEVTEFLTKKAYLQAESTIGTSNKLTLSERELLFPESSTNRTIFEEKPVDTKLQNNIRVLSSRRSDYDSTKDKVPQSMNFIKFLITNNHEEIAGLGKSDFVRNSDFVRWSDMDFAYCWIDIFNFALHSKKSGDLEELHTLLTFLVYKDIISLTHAFALSAIARNPDPYLGFKIPPHCNYYETSRIDVDLDDVQKCFCMNDEAIKLKRQQFISSQPMEADDTTYSHEFKNGRKYDDIFDSEVQVLAEKVFAQWPAIECVVEGTSQIFKTVEVAKLATSLFKRRFIMLQLVAFLTRIETFLKLNTQLASLPELFPVTWSSSSAEVKFRKPQVFNLTWNSEVAHFDMFEVSTIFARGNLVNEQLDLFNSSIKCQSTSKQGENDPVSAAFFEGLVQSLDAYHTNQNDAKPETPTRELLQQQRARLSACSDKLFSYIQFSFNASVKDTVGQALIEAGVTERAVPLKFLPLILPESRETTRECIDAIGAMAVIWTQEQRIERCLQHIQSDKRVYLDREFENAGHTNWSPAKRPEWLLLELEQNWMIRPVQVEIALRMLNPPKNENVVMQLNMGEGKTSVIVPLLIASITKTCKAAAQVVTLNSLLPSNCISLADKLGGLIHLKLFQLPFRRRSKLTKSHIDHIANVTRNEILGKGFLVTVPEYLMSFHLKVIEECRKDDESAKSFMDLEQMFNNNVRSILDESDEILHVKRQLVYTIGSQVEVGGKSHRWSVLQELLYSVKRHLPTLLKEFGNKHVMLNSTNENRRHEFPAEFRFVGQDRDVYVRLCRLICEDLIQGRIKVDFISPNKNLEKMIVDFLISEEITQKQIDSLNSEYNIEEVLLIIRGLLAFNIFHHCFTLRYKVNYGIGPHRKMAVPFRAKDVAAEKTEFGHADVALLLTQLTYYYQGLPDSALEAVFQKLLQLDDSYAESIYNDWISQCAPQSVNPRLRKLFGVNLSDLQQKKTILFPLFKKHMAVINYWLANFVYPKECKQFPHKLVSNSWDLCPNVAHPVTGFSGTNDTECLLPPTINQRDLPQLKSTNGSVIASLMRPENNNYHHIAIGQDAENVLREVLQRCPETRVILDVGALVIEMNNLQVAQTLLKIAPSSILAAIYFDVKDRMMVMDRKGRNTNCHLSPFSDQLEKCITYLDEIHTRGTDLQFPGGTQAVVTLGKGLQKDRLVQACMRMRLLGKGHSVAFLATDDVHRSICEMSGNDKPPDTGAVLKWACSNSVKQIQDGLIHWSHQGLSRLQKIYAKKEFELTDSLKDYGNDCTFTDVLDLRQMYCKERARKLHYQIVQTHAEHIQQLFSTGDPEDELHNVELLSIIVDKCKTLNPTRLSFVHIIDEEQERELEQEQEEQMEIIRPAKQRHRKPQVPLCVKQLVRAGVVSSEFLPLSEVLRNTQIYEQTKRCFGTTQIKASPEFGMVLDSLYQARDGLDSYLRDPFWILRQNSTGQLFLVTGHEVNCLFRELITTKVVTLLMFTPVIHKNQCHVLHEAKSLSLPPGRQLLFSEHEVQQFGELHVFSGNLYFKSQFYEQLYCNYLGVVPRPRSKELEKAFGEGLIEPRGFVRPENRLKAGATLTGCPFTKSPIDVANSLISIRGHGEIMMSSHAYMILFRCRRNLTDDCNNNQ